ncbi:MAG: ankyrin repeat domain-containing protein [Moraxellaceae bacterium]|nr:ankyrin repeat domain-containing protein [Moraxellaceae bacterium]MDP1776493.1 ankyrin repeat domain-containing protein [Moraxellaceae bacterium]MDZ4299163.1 ankyrin repeat domain-containing protein [Moraxellaceae bacterium]MDZ4386285.1 ankyrin repeat domain-containing protein [Moraxellaceae bacterium]
MDGGNWKELFNAACEGDIELVKYHVKCGVDINYAHPEFLSTPLVACALAGQEQVALYLLESGANPHLYSEFDAMTPIQAACQANLNTLQEKLMSLGVIMPEAVSQPSVGWFQRIFLSRALR